MAGARRRREPVRLPIEPRVPLPGDNALGPWLRNEISIQSLLLRNADEKPAIQTPAPAPDGIADGLAALVDGMDGNAAERVEHFLSTTLEPFRAQAPASERTRADATVTLLESALLLLHSGETESACKETKRALQAWTGDPDLDLLTPSRS